MSTQQIGVKKPSKRKANAALKEHGRAKPLPFISTLSLTFDIPLRHSDIPKFRSAVLRRIREHRPDWPEERAALFHNHLPGDGGIMNRYPLVQYRSQGGRATLFGVNEGAEALDELFRALPEGPGDMAAWPVVDRDRDRHFTPAFCDDGRMVPYKIYGYIPFDPERYAEYKASPSMGGKLTIMEQALTNALVTTLKQLGLDPPGGVTIRAEINDLDRKFKARTHRMTTGNSQEELYLLAFDLGFSANVLLPDRLAIGRKKAEGYGWLYQLPRQSG